MACWSETGSRRYLTHDYNVCKFWCVSHWQAARLLLPPAILFSPCGQFVRETVRTPRLDSAQNATKLAPATAQKEKEGERERARGRERRRGRKLEQRMFGGIIWMLHSLGCHTRLVVEQFIIAAN